MELSGPMNPNWTSVGAARISSPKESRAVGVIMARLRLLRDVA
jgi:hypothetical protein